MKNIFLIVFMMVASPALAVDYAVQDLQVSCDRWPSTYELRHFGKDCARIASAQNDSEKAIAVWRFIQQMTEVGTPPKEPAYNNKYVLSPQKLLNVYGVHWCDGLARIMTMTWRAMGYRADKLYRFGHTLADCWWKDSDGIRRSHVFDLSDHWFVYDRTGKDIASAGELALDHSLQYYPSNTPVPDKPSPMQPSWVHAGHLDLKSHSTRLNLRQGERIQFFFGNLGKPYHDLFPSGERHDFEHGPYPLTYGNGRLVTHVDLEKNTSEKVVPIELPYVISDVLLTFSGQVTHQNEKVILSLSTDGGQTWRRVWKNKSEHFEVQRLDVCPDFDPASIKQVDEITPFGRYEYLLKVEQQGQDPLLNNLKIETVFQHNMFALPMLFPGKNTLRLQGDKQKDAGLRISYHWDDAQKRDRKHVQDISSLPATFSIQTAGEKWDEVRCRSMSIEVGSSKNNSQELIPEKSVDAEQTLNTALPYPTRRSIGEQQKRSPDFARDLSELEKALKDNNRSVIADRIVALGALQDSRSAEILKKVIFEDTSSRKWHKILACQALYQSINDRAAPVMIRILERDPALKWPQSEGKWNRDAMWLHTAAVAAAILADIQDFSEKRQVAHLIAAILKGESTSRPIDKLPRGGEIAWGLIRNLGKLGDKRHLPLLISYLEGDRDRAALAIEALGRIGDRAAMPHILPLLETFEYPPVGLKTIQAIGQLGKPQQAQLLYPFLSHWDEAFRGGSAQALGRLGEPQAIPELEKLLKEEKFSWVRETARESLKKLGKK